MRLAPRPARPAPHARPRSRRRGSTHPLHAPSAGVTNPPAGSLRPLPGSFSLRGEGRWPDPATRPCPRPAGKRRCVPPGGSGRVGCCPHAPKDAGTEVPQPAAPRVLQASPPGREVRPQSPRPASPPPSRTGKARPREGQGLVQAPQRGRQSQGTVVRACEDRLQAPGGVCELSLRPVQPRVPLAGSEIPRATCLLAPLLLGALCGFLRITQPLWPQRCPCHTTGRLY
ncbi:translation initiation factor IF-2-like [Panthera tigris]|uniref:translation initiation factor IF-2-like n=1 Tax=Panthera tigris TaxID=9694 RepID=UPI001C6F7666|nr:translation initiation factor IF-2-like [Panthera tigris]